MENRLDIFIDDEHSYIYEIEGRKHRLMYSNSPNWTEPETTAFEVIDTGNSLKYKKVTSYHETQMLSILLRLIHRGKIQIAQRYELD